MQIHERVVVTSTSPPSIEWWCPSCKRVRMFACRDAFRMNANGKNLDIWVLYRCEVCDRTKKLSVLERTPVRRVPPQLLAAAEINDAAVAHRFARDIALLRRNSARLAEPDRWHMSPTISRALASPNATVIDLDFPDPLLVPILSLTADLFQISSSELSRLVTHGRIAVSGSAKMPGVRLWSHARILVAGRSTGSSGPARWPNVHSSSTQVASGITLPAKLTRGCRPRIRSIPRQLEVPACTET